MHLMIIKELPEEFHVSDVDECVLFEQACLNSSQLFFAWKVKKIGFYIEIILLVTVESKGDRKI